MQKFLFYDRGIFTLYVLLHTQTDGMLSDAILNLPSIRDELYAISIITVQVNPREGVYIISVVPTMKPPSTHVATA